ncbi:MAG TPA: glycosyltransferase family 2 protein, partial [Planctomycetota bacterium]|nr:glycosyltransferase family 2 protein [Planctomycetota bacterium]
MRNGRAVWAVVPAFDEERLIARTLAGVPDFVDRVVVVDDASRDATAARARAAGGARTQVVRRTENGGVGAAIVDGYRAFLAAGGAPGDACVVMAGDAQMDPADLPALLDALDGGAGYAKGNRFLRRGTFRAMPWVRWCGNRALSAMTRAATGYRIGDSQCGYAAITRAALARVDLARLWPRYGFPNDLLVKLASAGETVVDVPVRAVYGDETSRLVPWRVAPRLVGILWRGLREVRVARAARAAA